MSEAMGAVISIALICAGTASLRKIHDEVGRAALAKAAQGLPSLVEMNRKLHQQRTINSRAKPRA
jgi:hypothetical protein